MRTLFAWVLCPVLLLGSTAFSQNLPPSNVRAVTNSPFTATLTWRDNSVSETKFEVYLRILPSLTFQFFLGETPPNVTNFVAAGLLDPGTTNEIAVQAPGIGFASTFVTTPRFDPPSLLKATMLTPATVQLTWRDNTTNEATFEVAHALGTNTLFDLIPGSQVGPNVTNFTATFLTPGTTNKFLIVAYYADQFSTNYVLSTNVTIVLPQFRAPTNVIVTATNGRSFGLRWSDVSTNEANFRVAIRSDTNQPFFLADNGTLPANTTNFTVAGLEPATVYEYFVEAYIDDSTYVRSPVQTVTTLNAFLSRAFHPAVVDEAFSYTLVPSSNLGDPNSVGLLGELPPGLEFDEGTREISGVPTMGGVYQVQMTADYPGSSITNPLTLRVIYPPGPPLLKMPIPAQVVTKGGPPVNLPLPPYFVDRDAEKAVRFNTTLGSFELALYPTATPATVSNFFNYVNRGDYSNTVVHRSAPGFVVQGGSFRTNGTNFISYPLDPPVLNEPGVQHVRGTVSVPKSAGNENSGAAGIFFNLADNSSQLDDQTGGFAAFGRVTGNGMSVVDAMAALPRGDYILNLDGVSRIFDEFPVNAASAPAVYNPVNNVMIQSVSNIPPLQWSVGTPAITGLVSVAIVGTNLQITPTTMFGGITEVPVITTDLDGNSLTQQVVVQVSSAYTTWLNSFGLNGTNSLPGTDVEPDLRENALEFALGGNPLVNDSASLRGTNAVVSTGGQPYLAMRFRLRKDLSGGTALLQGLNALGSTNWTNVWTSADLNGPQVMEKLDQGEFWGLLVRDVISNPTNRFLQLRLQVPQ